MHPVEASENMAALNVDYICMDYNCFGGNYTEILPSDAKSSIKIHVANAQLSVSLATSWS